MSLAVLQNYDSATAANILAAAALKAAPNPGVGTSAFEEKYADQAEAVLNEVRERLKNEDRKSRRAKTSLSEALSREIESLLLHGKTADEALKRAGQAGRLVPSIYTVIQPKHFRERFSLLGIKKYDVESAVHRPDDYQHMMTEYAADNAKDAISLFMKLMRPSGQDSHWLLVQTLRVGTEQHVQSAWRVYPSIVNLDEASEPLDVLKAFVEVFGMPLSILGGKTSKFVERIVLPAVDGRINYEVGFNLPAMTDYFMSVSNIPSANPNLGNVGIAYVIDTSRYRKFLINKGVIRA